MTATDATTSISKALSGALTRQARLLQRAAGPALSGDATAIHDARVASRRVRELLALADELWPALGADGVARQVRRLTRALGQARELDVSLARLDAPPASWPADAVAAVRRALERDRLEQAHRLEEAAADIDLPKLKVRTAGLVTAIAQAPWARASQVRLVRERVAGRATSLSAAIARCGTLYAVERLHAIRLAAKKLRYAVEAQRAVGAGGRARDLTRLKQTQQALGDLHDLQVLQAHVDAVLARGAAQGLASALAEWLRDLERACREAHAAILPGLGRLSDLTQTLAGSAGRGRRSSGRMLRMAATPAVRRRTPA